MAHASQYASSVAPSVDETEIAKFSAMAEEWWDPNGKFKPLHQLNPARLTYIRDQLCQHFNRDAKSNHPLKDLKLLDIGCGGGLLSEPMARLGATVLGADMSSVNIEIAKAHARQQDLNVTYHCISAEALADDAQKFDVIVNMEVIEHVADMPSFLRTCLSLLNPGGIMLVSTINRTVKAFGLAVIGAEYILRWLPIGTHDFKKFIKPDEIKAAIPEKGFRCGTMVGMSLNPLTNQWALSKDLSVNYMLSIIKED